MKFAVWLAVFLVSPSPLFTSLLFTTADSTSMGFNDVLDIVSKTGILGFALLILWTGRRGVWVWGSAADSRVQTERERAERAEQRAERAEAKLEETRRANEDRIEGVIPAVSESTHANIEARAEMQRLILEVSALKDAAALLRDSK